MKAENYLYEIDHRVASTSKLSDEVGALYD